jgi:hypothetical protein
MIYKNSGHQQNESQSVSNGMKKKINIKTLKIDAKVSPKGIDIYFNGKKFPIIYPPTIWQKYDSKKKAILKDNIALSSTFWLPLLYNLKKIGYQTSRPLSETFLYKNGIYDMPSCGSTDNKSIEKYIRNFFNTQYIFKDNSIKNNDLISFRPVKKKTKTAIIPFSFGKESLLSLCLCLEIGIKPVLVHFVEPCNEREFYYIKQTIKRFQKETGLIVHIVRNNPGVFRYGKYNQITTDLGWGLQTTEYVMLSLPFAAYYNADYIILGNERSCDETAYEQGFLTYECGYDQTTDWIKQQGLLGSLLLGKKIDVISLVEPIDEPLIIKILLNRYPKYSKYLTSCNFGSSLKKNVRWCQTCPKCGSIYALACAFKTDPKSAGFTEGMFDKKHLDSYKYFFNNEGSQYFTQEELELAFYLAYRNGSTGYSIDKFKKEMLPRVRKNFKRYCSEYLGVHTQKNIPTEIWSKLFKIYRQETKW